MRSRAARVRAPAAADRGRVHHRLRGAADHRGAARRHPRAPPGVPRPACRCSRWPRSACGLAPSAGSLVALRFVQGVGAAAHDPAGAQPDPADVHRRRPRARAISRYAAVMSGGAVLGQVLGGVLVSADMFGSTWRPVFLVNVPVGVAVLAFGRLLPAADADTAAAQLDLPGLLTLTPAVLAFVLPLVLGQSARLARLGMGAARGQRRAGRRPRPRRAARARPRWPADPAPRAARRTGVATGIAGMFMRMLVFGGLALHADAAPAGRVRRLGAALRPHLRPRRRWRSPS